MKSKILMILLVSFHYLYFLPRNPLSLRSIAFYVHTLGLFSDKDALALHESILESRILLLIGSNVGRSLTKYRDLHCWKISQEPGNFLGMDLHIHHDEVDQVGDGPHMQGLAVGPLTDGIVVILGLLHDESDRAEERKELRDSSVEVPGHLQLLQRLLLHLREAKGLGGEVDVAQTTDDIVEGVDAGDVFQPVFQADVQLISENLLLPTTTFGCGFFAYPDEFRIIVPVR
jgi:hypothetical protein